MLLEEMQALCNREDISQEELDAIHPIYCMLGFDKAVFCKLVNAIGLAAWLAAENRWSRLDKAAQLLFYAVSICYAERFCVSLYKLTTTCFLAGRFTYAVQGSAQHAASCIGSGLRQIGNRQIQKGAQMTTAFLLPVGSNEIITLF